MRYASPLIWRWRGLRSVAFVYGFLLATQPVAFGQGREERGLEQAAPAAEQISFAIPAAPLEDALLAYARTSGTEVFVDHALVVGRRSTPVVGAFGAEEALRRLLDGSGLEIRAASLQGYTLIAPWGSVREPPPDRMPNWTADTRRAKFLVAVQAALKRVLCSRVATAPGTYRAALALWFDTAGQVVETRLLGTTADPGALRDALQGMSVREPPPPDLEQPVTLVILPRPSNQTGDCATRDVAGR